MIAENISSSGPWARAVVQWGKRLLFAFGVSVLPLSGCGRPVVYQVQKVEGLHSPAVAQRTCELPAQVKGKSVRIETVSIRDSIPLHTGQFFVHEPTALSTAARLVRAQGAVVPTQETAEYTLRIVFQDKQRLVVRNERNQEEGVQIVAATGYLTHGDRGMVATGQVSGAFFLDRVQEGRDPFAFRWREINGVPDQVMFNRLDLINRLVQKLLETMC